jgi:hypothetical protein
MSWAFLAVMGLVVAMGAGSDLVGRASSPETVVRRYLAALQTGDVDAALRAIAPNSREQWTPFVENGVGNEYRVVGVAVRQPSLLARIGGEPGAPTEATVFLDITQAVEDVRWQTVSRVPLVELGGRWYLNRPPLSEL